MSAARTSLPSSAIIIRRYTGKPAGRYRASPGRLGRKVICPSPRPPSLRRWLNRATAGMSSSATKRMFMITTPTIFIRGEIQSGDFQVQERPQNSYIVLQPSIYRPAHGVQTGVSRQRPGMHIETSDPRGADDFLIYNKQRMYV